MRKNVLFMAISLSFVLTACGGDSGSSAENGNNTADAGDEAKIYMQKCSQCHGAELEGGVGPNLSGIGGELSKEEIETIILEGKGGMPKELIKGEEASAVAEWLAEKK
ncbi:cytochrome c [Bacillaceae bacterium Marseille-Q3522]|nr:cytochrome c [Bacillaceae bacterium Marseille-Q3522]